MNHALTVIFSFERFDLLRLSLLFAIKYIKPYSALFVIDDGSTDDRIPPYLQKLNQLGYIDYLILKPDNEGIGYSRHEATQFFIESERHDHLIQIDSDIIIGRNTVPDAIKDFEMIKKEMPVFETAKRYWWDPGALSFYHLYQIVSEIKTDSGKFGMQMLSGEAAFLTSKEVLRKVGNTFTQRRHSEADEFWHTLYQNGLQLITKLTPNYQVQHIGVNTNVVFNDGFIPAHSRKLLTDYEGNIIKVDNFDHNEFMKCLENKNMECFIQDTMEKLELNIPL